MAHSLVPVLVALAMAAVVHADSNRTETGSNDLLNMKASQPPPSSLRGAVAEPPPHVPDQSPHGDDDGSHHPGLADVVNESVEAVLARQAGAPPADESADLWLGGQAGAPPVDESADMWLGGQAGAPPVDESAEMWLGGQAVAAGNESVEALLEAHVGARPCLNHNWDCIEWSNQGWCQKKPEYMMRVCYKACVRCIPPPSNCENHDWNCISMAKAGRCTSDPAFMGRVCRKACLLCRP